MPLTTVTTQASIVTPEFIMRARIAARGVSVFSPGAPGRLLQGLLDVVDLRGKGTRVASWPIEDYHTAYNVADGVDHTTSQSYDPTDNVATASEIIAIETISKIAMKTADERSIARATRMLGIAIGEKIDTDVLALNTSLDTDVGSTGAAATFALLSNGPQTLGAARYPGPYNCVLHDIQWYDLVNQGTTTLALASGILADQFATTYQVRDGQQVGGMNRMIVTPRVPSANSSADRSGAIFSSFPAYGLAELWWGEIEQEKDASLRGTEIVITSCYGLVEIDGAAAVAFETDY